MLILRSVKKTALALALSLAFSGCSGYKLISQTNPFAVYQIKSISLPMFLNKSSIPHASPPFTNEIFELLSSYPGLTVYSGINKQSDALLLGIISSPQYLNQTIALAERRKASSLAVASDIGTRNDFFIPTRNYLKLSLQLILIKNPTYEDRQLFQSPFSQNIEEHPRLIANETIHLSVLFDRQLLRKSSGGTTNFTNNLDILNQAIKALAKEGGVRFKRTVVDAF